METIYSNNDVTFQIERVDHFEAKVNVNGENLIWINRVEQERFIKELQELFDKYRI